MKALVYVAPERMEIQEIPEPPPAAGEVLLKVGAAGVCGSDLHGFLGHSERRKPGLVMGHEAVATILELHPSVRGWRRGQRVCFNPLLTCGSCRACLEGRQNLCPTWTLFGMDRLHGTYAERIAVPVRQLQPLSEGLSEQEAVLAEPMAVVIHAFRLGLAGTPRVMAIIGAGAIGSLSLVLAKLRGVPKVCVVDVNDARLEVAKRLGADLTLDAARADLAAVVRDWSSGGADVVVEAVGTAATRRTAVALAAKGARLVLLGLAENESALPWIDVTRNEQAFFTSFAYAPRDFHDSVDLLESRRVDIRAFTETRPLEEGQAGFLKMTRAPGATLKLVLKP
ncbi:MAG TPA: alcohol dehydrogenase catalytic domain-containing protein [Vicinamibacteria bacterium]|nr:alcohol dehydrogenase catalytic domain-containing protein [Vicinamibacteria bacterium]